MKRTLSTFLFISTLLCVAMIAMGQDFPTLQVRAETAVKSKRPDIKLFRKEEKDKEVVYQWGPKDDGVGLLIFYGASHEEAAERMKATLKILSAGPGRKLTDLGDEAYFWKSGRGGFAGVRFRKSNVYIDLVAPSAAMAKDLAKSLAQEIQKK